MKQFLCLFLISFPLFLHAQLQEMRPPSDEKGIKFEKNQSWQQIKGKARAANKYIFVDCYASWCGPCKEMDRMVYPVEELGTFMNEHFISVKVQMDTTASDNEAIREWYQNAAEIQKQYRVYSFPTYLFFSPYGKLVHRYSGAMPMEDFLKVTANATSAQMQYYTLLENYRMGIKRYEDLPYMIQVANRINDTYTARQLSNDFLKNYLYQQPEAVWLKRENIEIMATSVDLIRSTDKMFILFYQQPEKVDQVIGRGYAQDFTDWIISNEEIKPRLYKEGKAIVENPDWERLTSTIQKKYSKAVAQRIVLNAQLRWYEEKKDWSHLIKYTIQKKEQYGLDTVGIGKTLLNNMIYSLIFQHSNDSTALNKGIEWMELLINVEPDHHQWLDTYANLLYKAGRKNEALNWEEKAIQLATERKIKTERDKTTLTRRDEIEAYDNFIKDLERQIKGYEEMIIKVKQGKPTWGRDEN